MPLFIKSRVKSLGSKARLAQGVVFKVNAPDSVVARVAATIDKNKGSQHLTCLHGLCQVLHEAEIEIPGANGVNIKLKRVVSGILDGNINMVGRKLTPDQVKMIATSAEQLDHFIKVNRHNEASIKVFYGTLIIVSGLAATDVGYYGYELYQMLMPKDNH